MDNSGAATSPQTSLALPIGASHWERDIYGHLTEHIIKERALLEEIGRAHV